MSQYKHPTDVIVNELREMRDRIATAARGEDDRVSYRAYLLQARSIKAIEEQVAGQNAAASARAIREGITDDAEIEGYWLTMLAEWLVYHEKLTRESLEGGETDRLPFAVGGEEAKAISRLHAKRHHEMISGFCERHVAVLRERADVLERDKLKFHELQPTLDRTPCM
ncbi:hypothetical protein O9X98_10915 [Agrobacterium salinitolerans]|nr:hypothetical protein [Agrobacterium salinitolerans]